MSVANLNLAQVQLAEFACGKEQEKAANVSLNSGSTKDRLPHRGENTTQCMCRSSTELYVSVTPHTKVVR